MIVGTSESQSAEQLQSAQLKIARALRGWHYSSGEDVTLFEGFSLGALGQLGMAETLVRLFRQAANGFDPNSPRFWDDGIEKKYGLPPVNYVLTWHRKDWKAGAFRTFYALRRKLAPPRASKSALVIASSANRVLWDCWLRRRSNYGRLSLDFALQFPPGFANACRSVLAGASIFDPQPVPLIETQGRRLDAIRSSLLDLPKSAEWRGLFEWNGLDLSALFKDRLLLPFVRQLEEIAVQCLAFEKEFQRLSPNLLILPQDLSPEAKILQALAKRRDIPVWFLNHGFLGYGYSFDENFFMSNIPMDRVIAWGKIDRDNFVRAGYSPSTVEVLGNPAFDALFPLVPFRPYETIKNRTALLLAYARPYGLAGFYDDNEERYFREIVTLLDRQGVRKILFKIHAGRQRLDHYKQLASELRLRTPIEFFQKENILQLIAQSDFVIGPVSTAVFETLLEGRDYFFVHYDPAPTPAPVELHEAYVAKSISELEKNLLEVRPLPRKKMLEEFCGIRGDEGPWHFSRKILDRIARELHQ